MISRKGEQNWFFPYDFMKPECGDYFVGYEATARISELTKSFPEMIETGREGKYRTIRFRFENIEKILESSTDLMRRFLSYQFDKHRKPMVEKVAENASLF